MGVFFDEGTKHLLKRVCRKRYKMDSNILTERFMTEFQLYSKQTESYKEKTDHAHFLFNYSKREKLYKLYRRKLETFCLLLVKNGSFTLLMDYVCSVLLDEDNPERDKQSTLRGAVNKTSVVSIWDQCIDYYQAMKPIFDNETKINVATLIKVGHMKNYMQSYLMAKSLGVPFEEPDQLYGLDLEPWFARIGSNITTDLIDRIVKASEHNFGKSYRKMLPGILLPFFMYGIDYDNKVVFYILEEYILDSFYNVPWYQTDSPDTYILAYLFDDYISRLIPYINTADFFISAGAKKQTEAPLNIADVLYKEIIVYCKKKPLSHQYIHTIARISDVFYYAQPVCEKIMEESIYSRLVQLISYCLYLSNDVESTASFLIKYYNTIVVGYRRDFNMQAILTRCIMNSTDIHVVNTLYGLYSNELSVVSIDYEHYYQMMGEIIRFLEEIRKSVRDIVSSDNNPHIDVFRSMISDESLFSSTIDCALQLYIKKEKLELFPLQNILTVLSAFCLRPGTVYLNILKLSVDGYAKIEIPFSGTRYTLCSGYLKQIREIISFIDNVKLMLPRQTISGMVVKHIFTLFDKDIDDYILKLSELKQLLSREINQEIKIQIQQQIEDCLEWLNKRANEIAMEKPSLVRNMFFRVESFKNNHQNVSFDDGLISDISYDDNQIRKWLITGEFLLQSYSFRKDTDDYSAAINPFSKAMELALHLAYWKMAPRKDEGELAIAAARPYLKDGQFQKDLDTGLLINLLQDREYFGIKENGEFEMSKKKKKYYSCFDNWDGRNAFDIPVLKKFTDIEFKCMLSNDQICNLSMDNNNFRNRQVLYLALKYIKEKYRNPSSHTGTISREEYDEYVDIMIGKGSLLWVLLSVIRK